MEIKLPGKSGIADKVKCNLGEFARKVDNTREVDVHALQ